MYLFTYICAQHDFNVCPNVMMDSLSCSFPSIFFHDTFVIDYQSSVWKLVKHFPLLKVYNSYSYYIVLQGLCFEI